MDKYGKMFLFSTQLMQQVTKIGIIKIYLHLINFLHNANLHNTMLANCKGSVDE